MTYQAKDIMKREVIAVASDMDLRDLAKLFLERGITGAPVLGRDGELTGVISQTDLVYYNLTRGDELVLDSHFYQNARVEGHHIPKGFQVEDFNSGIVADVMTPVVHSVTEASSVESVARLMSRKHIHRVIVRKGKRVAGIISAIDVLRHYDRLARESARGSRKPQGRKTTAKRTTSTRPGGAKRGSRSRPA